jgi:Na+/H+ antiporter NhaD/arsenite permease-like protein
MKSQLISFTNYLTFAFPLFFITAIVITTVHILWLRRYDSQISANISSAESQLSIEFLGMKYRHWQIAWSNLAMLAVVFVGMFIGWSFLAPDQYPPVGLGALLVLCNGSRLSLTCNMESMIRLAAFLFIAALAKGSGILEIIAEALQRRIDEPLLLLCSIMVLTALLSGVFSAGPTAAAMIPVFQQLAEGPLQAQQQWLAIGFAAFICAGSSLFLWSATAGFLLLDKVKTAKLTDRTGRQLEWGVMPYFKYGLLHFLVQISVALAWVLISKGQGINLHL